MGNEREFDRRAEQKYYVFTEPQIRDLVDAASAKAAQRAVDEFIALLGRKTIRNIGLCIASILALASTWVTGLVHFGPKP